jgi:hypothetical protein
MIFSTNHGGTHGKSLGDYVWTGLSAPIQGVHLGKEAGFFKVPLNFVMSFSR